MHTITLSANSFIRLAKPLFGGSGKAHSVWAVAFIVLLGLLSSAAQGQTLQISKSVDATQVYPNGGVKYTIQYNCTSITDPCTNVIITDRLPNGLGLYGNGDLITSTGTASLNGQTVTFNLGTLAAGTTGEVSIQTHLDPSIPGGTVLPNSATITSGAGSSIVSNTVSTTALSSTNLKLSKSVYTASPAYLGSGLLVQGQTGIYQLGIANQDNTPLTNLCVIDTLPFANKLQATAIATGAFSSQAPPTVRVEYQTNANASWTALSGSPFSTGSSTTVPVNLPAGEYITMVRWCFDQPYNPNASTSASDAPLIFFNIQADMPQQTVTNCISSSASNLDPIRVCAAANIIPPVTGSLPGIEKKVVNPSVFPGDTIAFTLTLSNQANAAQALKNGVIADPLSPATLTYVPNSWSYTSTYSAVAPTFGQTTVSDGNNLLRWTLNDDVPIGQAITVTFKAVVASGSGGSPANTAMVIGSNVQPQSCATPSFPTGDGYDIDGDGNTTENVCIHQAVYYVRSLPAILKSEKLVKGQLDAVYSKYPAFGQTVPGGLADYRLKVYNPSRVAITNAVVIDILPFVGDVGVLDPQTRLSQWRPNLAGPVTPPTGVTVYYSTQQNPCRPELNYSPAGCTTANWSTVPPNDITTVQALKFDFGSKVVNPGDSLFLSWPMRAPTTAPTNGEIAWNSFGYIATRSDNNTQLLPAEPIKVGIKANPLVPAVYGDFVWLDINKDGIQDVGELGVSGVKVELYKDNGDGIPNKTTDALVGFTVTDGSGNYLFSSLQPGDYFAVFYPPSGYAVSPSLAGTDRSKDSEGIITTVTHLDAQEIDLNWDLGIYPSTTCDVKITNTTVSPCSYSGGLSRATVNVFVTWANAPASQNITVSLAGAAPQTIDVTGGATSPALVSFTIAADGASHALTAGFTANCQDQASVLSPVPCAPAVCSLGITNVLTGACSKLKRPVTATVSWSNNPVGENIIVTWDGVPVDTILVSGGLGSPQTASFPIPGDGATHTIAAQFASTTACQASVSGITAPACTLPCGLNMIVTPSLCEPATNAYVLSGTITATNVPTSGTLTITSGAFAPRSLTLPAGNASGTFSYSGLVSNGQPYTVTASYSNAACSPVSQTFTAPVSCSVAPPCSLSATASAGLCNLATNTYSATVVVGLTNATAGTLTVDVPGASGPISQTIAANTASFTAVLGGLVSDGASHTATVSLPGCGTTTAKFTAPVSCSVAPICAISGTATPGFCASVSNTYSLTTIVTVQNPPAGGTVSVSTGGQTIPFSTTANSQNTFTAVFNGLVSDGQSHTVVSSLPGCGTANTVYTAPVSCSTTPTCSLSATVTPGICASTTNTYSATAVVTVQNPANGGTLTISNGTTSQPFTTTAGTSNTFTMVFNGLVSDGASHTIVSSLPGCGTATPAYTAPASCSTTPTCSLTPAVTAGQCASATNTYSATAVVRLSNPPAGVLTVTDGTRSLTTTIASGLSSFTYTATFNNLTADASLHTVTASLPGCTPQSVTYTAPASCSVAPVCSLSAVATPGICASATSTFSNTVAVTLTNPVAGTLTVTDGARSVTFVVAASVGTTTANAVFNGLPADGLAHTVTISLPGCGSATTTYTAPTACSVAPVCSLTATATPGICSTATNTYSATAVVRLTNPTAGTLTITDGPQSATFVTTSVSSATYTATFNGLTSDGTPHTITASLPGCSTTTTTYTAPGSCIQPAGTQLSLDKLVDKAKAKIGDVISYTLVLTNIGTTTATNVVVRDSATTGLRYVAGSATPPPGTTFTPGSPVSTWTLAAIPAGQSLSLTLQAIADSAGILYNRATIPGDTASVCTSVPVRVCQGQVYDFRLTAALGRSTYQWLKDGVAIAGQTTNVLSVTAAGTYSLAVDNVSGKCPDFSCCPFIIEEDTLPTFKAMAIPVTCVGNTAQTNGQIVLSNFTPGHSYQYSLGASFNPAASLSGAKQGIPANGVLVSSLANPSVGQSYTIRVYNASGCFRDVTVLLTPTVCNCPAEVCVPLIIQQTKRANRIGG